MNIQRPGQQPPPGMVGAHMLPLNLAPNKPGPYHGYQPQPVYQPGQGRDQLMAAGSHAMENAVEYGPEITAPQGTYAGQQPPHSPPAQGQGFNTQGKDGY